ncbi:MAG: inosine 5'-monophosphate dehydrogenase [Pelotomaculum sp. PtaB.Bin104]|nr:MAG: inosine 5'-monophosphate dehydrogenase [Pelotomaculum sp. PtaB.Bin104]
MNYSLANPIVRDVMTKKLITITPNLTVRQAKELMRTNAISGVPVVDQDQVLLGIISVV